MKIILRIINKMSFFTTPDSIKKCVKLIKNYDKDKMGRYYECDFKRNLSEIRYKNKSVGKEDLGMTLLHLATLGRANSLAKILIDNGSNPLLKDDLGNSCLDYAIQQNNKELVELFIEYRELKDKKNELDEERRKRRHFEANYYKSNERCVLFEHTIKNLNNDIQEEISKRVKTEEKIKDIEEEKNIYKSRWEKVKNSKRK